MSVRIEGRRRQGRRPSFPMQCRCKGREQGVGSRRRDRDREGRDARDRERQSGARHEDTRGVAKVCARILEDNGRNTASQRGMPPSARKRRTRIAHTAGSRPHPVGTYPPQDRPRAESRPVGAKRSPGSGEGVRRLAQRRLAPARVSQSSWKETHEHEWLCNCPRRWNDYGKTRRS